MPAITPPTGSGIHLASSQTNTSLLFAELSPEINPDEHVWEEIKDKELGRATIKSKIDLKIKLQTALQALQYNVDRVKSFFQLPETLYAT